MNTWNPSAPMGENSLVAVARSILSLTRKTTLSSDSRVSRLMRGCLVSVTIALHGNYLTMIEAQLLNSSPLSRFQLSLSDFFNTELISWI